ncbi:MAG: photosynthetic complex assembly protein PuhC [Comamonadaceae bacterium]|nr:MAG: photosynthetic complex assembly protein PuhC [Comamonadaceae bacterium]
MSLPATASGFPRAPLLAAGALVLMSLVFVGVSRVTGVGNMRFADAASVTTREFLFEDRADGSIAILQAPGRAEVGVAAPGTNGFLRGTMRGLARERKRQGIGADIPFQLIGRSDGRLTLVDPGTGRRVDLESFGPTNAAVFARLMAAAPPPQQPRP